MRARLVGRDREVRLLDQLGQHVDVERQRRRAFGRLRERREVIARHAAERVPARATGGLERRRRVVLRRDDDRTVRHHFHALEQVLRRHGDAARLAHFGRNATEQRQVQVRGREPHGVRAVDREQHVREHRHRALALRHALHARDDLQQILLRDRELHVVSPAPNGSTKCPGSTAGSRGRRGPACAGRRRQACASSLGPFRVGWRRRCI